MALSNPWTSPPVFDKENSKQYHTDKICRQRFRAVSDFTNKKSDLIDNKLCGWQQDVLCRVDTNKIERRRTYNKVKRKADDEDYSRLLLKLKKEAEFLESEEEEQKEEQCRRKMRFPTESDITNLIAKETKCHQLKSTSIDLSEQAMNSIVGSHLKQGYNSSVQLYQQSKKIGVKYAQTVKSRQRPSTSHPVDGMDSLLIKSFKTEVNQENTPKLQPIHSSSASRRHRRKVKSVTENSIVKQCEELSAGLVGNYAGMNEEQPKIITGMNIPSGILMFRKYNQMVRGKKIRTHRISTFGVSC